MNLNDYQWSHNPRGLHNAAATFEMDIDSLVAMKMGWAKLVVFTTLDIKDIPRMLANNITPIMRHYVPHFGATLPTSEMMSLYRGYFDAGVRWFELYNEPNLGEEWPDSTPPNYHNIPQFVAPLMQNWMTWAEAIISWGGYPAFPALTEASTAEASAPLWMDALLGYLRDNALDRFRNIAGNGMWLATHAVTLNHFYQEVPNRPAEPRPPTEQNGMEDGWHFEYPYDPYSQALDPGRTVFGNTPKTPYGDPNGLIAMGTAFMNRFQDWIGGGVVPVISTEGGIYPLPTQGIQQPDTRYPAYDLTSHAEATVGMFNWISNVAPPWMFGMCMWKEDEYLHGPGGLPIPAVARLKNTPTASKTVPTLATLGDRPNGAGEGKGPGPIHATPDYHFIMFAPDFNVNWFFQAGRAYWEQFRPVLAVSADYIRTLPFNKSLAITILASPASGQSMVQPIRDQWANVWVDLLMVKSADELAAVLNDRANNDKRFG